MSGDIEARSWEFTRLVHSEFISLRFFSNFSHFPCYFLQFIDILFHTEHFPIILLFLVSENFLYICSFAKFLIALGIDVNDHDIRFVEDNWESPVRKCLIRFVVTA